MINAELNRAILEAIFPIQCDLVGSENLEDLCAGQSDFADSDQAYRMDVSGSVELLANAVTIIGFVWAILKARPRTKLPTPPQIDELVLEVVQESKAIASEQRHAIYVTLRARRDAEMD